MAMLRLTALFSFVAAASSQFWGQGTYYGAGGNGASGACFLPNGYEGVSTGVAINSAQWDGGSHCGQCVRISGNGQGAGGNPITGTYYAVVDNLCPECKYGDLDNGLSGDGRWGISWSFVDCNQARYGANHPNRMLRGGAEVVEEPEGEVFHGELHT